MRDFITKKEFSQEEEKKMNAFDEMIGSNQQVKTTTKKAKKSAEIIPVPSNIQTEIDSLLKAKKAKKTAESDIKKSEPKIIDHGNTMKDEKAFNGKFQKSYKIGTDESHLNFVTANKWSFNEEDVEEIKTIFDPATANELIIKNTEVKLKADVFKNDDLKKKFVKMVGKEFPEFFETVVSHSVSADFDERIYDLAEEDLEDLRLLMKQSKPSLR